MRISDWSSDVCSSDLGFLISALGGSRTQVGGPTGAFVVVIFNVIAVHGYDGLLVATLLAGLILIAAGVLRLGQFIKFIPHPVITGFTPGISVFFPSSHVGDFLGLHNAEAHAGLLTKRAAQFGALRTPHLHRTDKRTVGEK